VKIIFVKDVDGKDKKFNILILVKPGPEIVLNPGKTDDYPSR
jgi:hypothetical protein